MNSTRAAQSIRNALWPGPGTATLEVASSLRAPLFTYASRSLTRVSRSGAAAGASAAVAAGAGSSANAGGVTVNVAKPVNRQATRAKISLFMTIKLLLGTSAEPGQLADFLVARFRAIC